MWQKCIILYLQWLSCGVPIFFQLLTIQEALPVLEIELDLQQKLYHVGPITSWPYHPENSNLVKKGNLGFPFLSVFLITIFQHDR